MALRLPGFVGPLGLLLGADVDVDIFTAAGLIGR